MGYRMASVINLIINLKQKVRYIALCHFTAGLSKSKFWKNLSYLDFFNFEIVDKGAVILYNAQHTIKDN